MLKKRTVIVLLAGVNLFLLAALILSISRPNTALAQAATRSGSFTCVTASATGQEYEILFVADLTGRKLHAFGPTNAQNKRLKYFGFRDLENDFRRQGNTTPRQP